MKKTSLLIALLLTLLFFTACGDADNINPENIQINESLGLNEQIYLSLGKPASGEYVVSYKAADAEEYTVVDKELLLDEEDSIGCYILGLKEGDYSVRVECGEGENLSRVTLNDINVERQDRSGYAHFNYDEGIGGYNNDGTVKENAKIIYISNATKNTVTLEINGTTYTGLVDILWAKAQMEEPLIIRVLDTITTNQWRASEADLEIDYASISSAEYVATLFSTEYGENLAGLPVIISNPADGTTYKYSTTPDGVGPLREREAETYYVNGTMGKLDTEHASNITIEGVGKNAGFYQLGFSFVFADSIEIKNLTFSMHPNDCVGFYSTIEDPTLYGRYWIHNNTFNRGNNIWDGESGDECVDFRNMHSATIAYNKFNNVGKAILIGGHEYDYHLNVTIHHNYYYEVEQRTPNSRHTNLHNYNNYYDNCLKTLSPRTCTYVFSEGNYFKNVKQPTYMGELNDETWGAVKSFNEIYDNCGDAFKTFVVKDRAEVLDTQKIDYTCSPDRQTDCSAFDTDPTLFYYDAENNCSDVEIMHTAEQVPDVVTVYAGAGVLTKLELDN